MCCICCCCCCCAVATGSTAKMSHCLCCCCYSGKESCIHPERVDVTPSHHQNNNIYRADIVNAQPVQPVEGQRVPYNPPVEPQFYPVQQPPIPQQPIPQQQYYYIPPVEQQQQQYIQQPNQTNNNNPPVVQYDEYDKVNYDNQQFERQESKKSEHILLPATSNK